MELPGPQLAAQLMSPKGTWSGTIKPGPGQQAGGSWSHWTACSWAWWDACGTQTRQHCQSWWFLGCLLPALGPDLCPPHGGHLLTATETTCPDGDIKCSIRADRTLREHELPFPCRDGATKAQRWQATWVRSHSHIEQCWDSSLCVCPPGGSFEVLGMSFLGRR